MSNRSARSRWSATSLLLLLLVVGCGAQQSAAPAVDAARQAPFADCSALTAAPAPAPAETPAQAAAPARSRAASTSTSTSTSAVGAGAVEAGAVGAGADGRGLPDITLPCFIGSRSVRLPELRGPAVLSLWGSWCGPCRREMPVMQRLADRTAGRLHVVGVNTRDAPSAAGSFGTDLRITVPNLFDPEERLRQGLGRSGLPVTVFVDTAGETFVYNGPVLDHAALAQLVGEHTGVTVRS